MSTAQDRNMNHLHQWFRTPFERWLADARAWCRPRGLDILVYETFRTAERQAWLYAQGRTRSGDIITQTLDSSHEYGMAADWVPLRLVNGRWVQDWSHATYGAIYAAVPLQKYGLERFSWEAPHVQLAGVNGPSQKTSGSVWAAQKGIHANVIVGSVWPLPAPTGPEPVPGKPVPAAARRTVLLKNKGEGWTSLTVPAAEYADVMVTRHANGDVQIGGVICSVDDKGQWWLRRAS